MNVFILIFLIAATIALQTYLSKQKNKWIGLILPLITFSISLMALLGVATFYQVGSVHVESQTIREDGVVISQTSEQSVEVDHQKVIQSIFIAVYVFVLYNVPTHIFMLIYKSSRKAIRKESEIQ